MIAPKKPEPARPVAIGTGLIALDIVFGASAGPNPQAMVGGTCGNVLTILSFLGWESFPVARLSQDPASELVRQDLRQCGVSLDFAFQEPPVETPVIVQTIRRDAAGNPRHRFSVVCPECGAWYPSFRAVTAQAAGEVSEAVRDARLAGFQPRVFFFDRVSRGALDLAVAMADLGALVVFEPIGIGDPKLFDEAVAVAHVLKYSHERLPELASRAVRSETLLLEIETRGAEGLRYRSRAARTWSWKVAPAFPAPTLLDTAGAGDWCTAGILTKIGREGWKGLAGCDGSRVEAAIRYGQAAAALACAYEGARGLMRAISRPVFDHAVDAVIREKATVEFDPAEAQIRNRPSVVPAASGVSICPACS